MDLGFAWGRAMRWTPVLCLLLSAPADAAECWYAPKSAGGSGPPELAAQGNCGKFAGPDEFRISRGHLGRLRFQDGLAEVRVENKAFYVDASGRAVRVHVFEHGADYFSEGLARAVSGGKIGCVDRRLKVVIEPEYDFGFPFAGGRAVVCIGCAAVTEGEHRAIRGGRWGMIDKTGAQVVPVRHTREEVEGMRRNDRGK